MSRNDEKNGKSASERVKTSAAAEKELLRNESRAEKELTKARKRSDQAKAAFDDASARYERRLADLQTAVTALCACQAARETGPDLSQPVDLEHSESAGAVPVEPLERDASPKPKPKAKTPAAG